jgi:hypothetical protein
MVIYIGFAALRLWFHASIQQVEGCDNILIVRFDKQTRILKKDQFKSAVPNNNSAILPISCMGSGGIVQP